MVYSIFLRDDVGSEFMAMLTGYFDESGTSDTEPCFVIAGYIAKVEQWIRFEQEWKRALGTDIPFFHTTDFVYGWKHYKGMDESEKFILLDKLLRIIRVLCTHHIGVAFSKKKYNKFSLEIVGKVLFPFYSFASLLCFKHIKDMADKSGYQDPIECIFEDGALHKGFILGAYQE